MERVNWQGTDLNMLETLTFLPKFKPGTVWLVGAGPGDPGLLSLHGLSGLQQCDCVIYDALVSPHLLELANSKAQLIFAGKRGGRPSVRQQDIIEILLRQARLGLRTLRLKGGDPLTFARGGEEIRALHQAGIAFRIVPGISASGGLAYAGIPLTDRQHNSVVSFVTGHAMTGELPHGLDWKALSTASPVLVFYMALKHIQAIADHLLAAGKSPDVPAAIIERATLPDQHVQIGRLGNLAEMGLAAEGPSIIVVGTVVDLHTIMAWDPHHGLRRHKDGHEYKVGS